MDPRNTKENAGILAAQGILVINNIIALRGVDNIIPELEKDISNKRAVGSEWEARQRKGHY